MLEDAGIDPDRFAIEWVSGAEGPRFAQKVTEFTETIKALGPNRFGIPEEEPCPSL
jgi:F420-non-reducing hydrogenase iron-sulfur subunit